MMDANYHGPHGPRSPRTQTIRGLTPHARQSDSSRPPQGSVMRWHILRTLIHKEVLWHPGKDGSAVAPFEAWFWQESARYLQACADQALGRLPSIVRRSVPLPAWARRASELRGGLDPRSGLATSLVIFGLFFVCVYLL